MNVVPNEWLLEFLVGDETQRQQARSFLDLLEGRGDLLIVRRHSPFSRKMYQLMKMAGKPVKRLYLMFFDANKVRLMHEDEIEPLPDDLRNLTPNDDVYLVETALAVPGAVIVTTDAKLKASLEGKVQMLLLDDFA